MSDDIVEQITGVPIEQVIEKENKITNVVMDATFLTSLMNCPRKSQFQFEMNLQSIRGKSNSLETGSLFHKFAEIYYRSLILGADKKTAFQYGMAAAELYIHGCKYCTDFVPSDCICSNSRIEMTPLESCEECRGSGVISKPKCGHPVNEYPGMKNTPPENTDKPYLIIGWQWVLKTCEQYAEFYRGDHWIPLEAEVVKRKVLYTDESMRIMWKAKLDLTVDTNQGIYPCDHKTMKQRRDGNKMNNQFKGQCLVNNVQKVIINKVGFQTTLKPEEKFIRNVVSYSFNQLDEWQTTTLPYYAAMLITYNETGYWPPNYSNCEAKYGKCPFLSICESDPGMRQEELQKNFVVGPKWDPINEGNDND